MRAFVLVFLFSFSLTAENLATYKGGGVTEAEIEGQIQLNLYQLKRQEYELRKQKLEELLFQKLVKLESEKQKLTEEQIFEKEVQKKTGAITAKEIDQFYEQRKNQLPQGKDFYAKQIEQFLGQQKNAEAQRNFFEKLKKKYNVAILLKEPESPFITVDVGDSPRKGPENATVTVVEFSDFQCPFCSRLTTALHKVHKEYPNKIRWVFKHFPLPSHAQATQASVASLCAADQGKFWEYHDHLFAHQNKLSEGDLVQYAEALKLDANKFKACLSERQHVERITNDVQYGKSLGVQSTPTFFINGKAFVGAVDEAQLRKILTEELSKKP